MAWEWIERDPWERGSCRPPMVVNGRERGFYAEAINEREGTWNQGPKAQTRSSVMNVAK